MIGNCIVTTRAFWFIGKPMKNNKGERRQKKENEEMRKFKKILAFSLASAMIVSAVPAAAATANTAKAGKATIYYNGNASYKSTWVKTTTKKGYTVKFFNKTASVATLDKKSGKVTAKKAGTAQVKVNFYKGGKYVGNKVVKIAIKKAPVGKGIKAEQTTLAVGETTKIVSSNGVKLNCYSADKKVVTVNKNTGVVTAVAPGTTKIAAVNAISGKKVYVEVTVNADLAAKQSGAKQITLTGSGFTKDTKVEVKKGNTVIDVDSAKQEASADGKTLIVPTKNVITAGEYAVTVGDKTVKFNGEASKVTSIEVSDVAVVDKGVMLPIMQNATASGATIAYVVKDQFGADITKTTNVTVSTNGLVSYGKGEIKVTLPQLTKKDDLVPVVVIYSETGLSVSKNVKVTDAAVVNEVTFAGVYNEGKKELTEDTAKSAGITSFYYLFDLVDQYGKSMVKKETTIGNNLNADLMLSVAPGTTGVAFDVDVVDNNGKVTTRKTKVVTKDGKDYVAVPLSGASVSAGKGSIIAMTKLGKSFNGEFEVKAGEKVDTFTASPSDVVVAGKTTVFDFTAVDTYGNDISAKATKDMFAKATIDSTFNANSKDYFKFAKNAKTGKNELVFVADKSDADKAYIATFITATNKVVTVQFTIKADQKPAAIGTADNFGMVADATRTKSVSAKDVNVTDQYGTKYEFKAFDADENGYMLKVVEETGAGSSVAVTGGKAVFTASNTAGAKNYKYQLLKGDKVISEEAFTVTTKALEDIVTEATDVTVKDMPKMYYNSERELEVTASINGAKVTLEADKDYVVYSNGTPTAKVVSGGVFGVQKNSAANTEVEGSYSIVIANGKGTAVTKKVLVCRADEEVKEAALKDDAADITTETVGVAQVLARVEVKDQYGRVLSADELAGTTRVTFTNAVDVNNKEVTVLDNGKTTAQAPLGKGGSATAELTFKNGKKFTTTVVVAQ